MSDLQKQIAKKKFKPPVHHDTYDDEDDAEEEKNELADQFPLDNSLKSKLNFEGPIKPTQSFQNTQTFQQPNKKLKDYSPVEWNQYFDKLEYMDNGTSLFIAGEGQYPIFLCLHGAGHSALSFALMASDIKKWGTVIAFDFRGHGFSKQSEDVEDLSLNSLVNDSFQVLEYICKKYPEPTIIIVGHSMGGAVASNFTQQALEQEQYQHRIHGMVIIDVVEGTAIEALPFMENIVNNRPQSFKSLDKAIQWSISSQQVRNLQSARVSIPPQLLPVKNDEGEIEKYVWKVDLMRSQKHWTTWFKGLTKSFLSIRIPKLLLLAEKERMDTDLTIAQMQGKFKLVVLYNVGHVMQEDDPFNVAKNLYELIEKFKIPISVEEIGILQQVGVGKFKPNLKPFA